ncbi:docking protein 3 isoform X2 [Eublepharis macularius]|uniref:Docking protein 3 isoform X2 n=1 Tax=Eublepharis macularius TaxID=481883 RepID=A0AA97KVR0_EUBMA|nr:docking protein 3 isoform X2 [Eublepharis macularius]
MECPVKDGILYIQHVKFGKKLWRKVWAQLFADSPSGVARLEYFETREGVAAEKATLRKGDCKVIRLSDCVSVERAGEHSSPKDTAPFYLRMMARNYIMAAEEPDDWIECVCQLAFQRMPASSSTAGSSLKPKAQMEENVIYSSWQETCEFPVVVFHTEASSRCGLKGNYLLVTLSEHLELKDSQSGKTLYTWPYAFLRRFGQDKTVFSFEAGRRCDSGEGLFTFNTIRAAEIYRIVSAAIDHQKATLLEAEKKPGISPVQDCMQKSGDWSWPTTTESLEEMYAGTPKALVEMRLPAVPVNDSHSVSPEMGTPEPPIIYASIGKSLPLLFQPWAETESKEHVGQLSDHLYENLCAREQHTFSPSPPNLTYRDSSEGRNNNPSPIYDNSPAMTTCSSSHPGMSPSVEADSFSESQYHHLLLCQVTEGKVEGEGESLVNPKPKTRGTAALKHKLVSLLSRDGGVKTSGKNTSPVDKL